MTTEEAKKIAEKAISDYQSIEVTLLGCGKDEGNPCVITGQMQGNGAKLMAIQEYRRRIADAEIDYECLVFIATSRSFYIKQKIAEWKLILSELEKL